MSARRATPSSKPNKKEQLRKQATKAAGGLGFDALLRSATPEAAPEAVAPAKGGGEVARKAFVETPAQTPQTLEVEFELVEGRLYLASEDAFLVPNEVLGDFFLPLSPYEKLAYLKLFQESFGRGLPLCRLSNSAIMSFTGVRSETTARKVLHSLQRKRYIAKLTDASGNTYDNQVGTLYRVFLPAEVRSGWTLEGRSCEEYFEAAQPFWVVAEGALEGLDLGQFYK